MIKLSSRTCILCDKKIPGNHLTCKQHWQFYLDNRNEQWIIELVDAERRQYAIDIEEEILRTGIAPKEKRTRRYLSPDDKQKIEYYFKRGVSYRVISKLTALNPYTVRNYVYKYLTKTSKNP
jgi:hypothetical protein